MMNRRTEARVLDEIIVDTRTYRYVLESKWDGCRIARLPRRLLDTTFALHGSAYWETMSEYDDHMNRKD